MTLPTCIAYDFRACKPFLTGEVYVNTSVSRICDVRRTRMAIGLHGEGSCRNAMQCKPPNLSVENRANSANSRLAIPFSILRPTPLAAVKRVPLPRPSADSNGTRKTAPFRWVASRRGPCSTSRAWAPPMTSSATARPCSAEDGAATTSTLVSLPTAWMRPRGSSRSVSMGRFPRVGTPASQS